jgi:hypothetical protein
MAEKAAETPAAQTPLPDTSAGASASSGPPEAQGADSAASGSGAGGQEGEAAGSSAAGEATSSPPAATEGAAGAEAPPAPKEDWREAKIRRLTARLHALEDKPGETETPAPAAAATPEVRLQEAEIERRAREIAQQNIAVDTFNRLCTEAVAAGRQQFPDFDTRITALRTNLSGGKEDLQQQVAYNQFVAAALETGQAPALFHQLGGDLDEAARIMSLPLVKMTVELTRLAGKAPDTTVSRAPKPITPVGSRGAPHTAIAPDDPERADRLSTREWMERRNAQEKAKFEARAGR